MKAGDLVRLPQGEGYAIVYKITREKNTQGLNDFKTAIVIREWGLDAWDADACMVISESR